MSGRHSVKKCGPSSVRWSDLGPLPRAFLVVLAIVEIVLLVAAQTDITRRGDEELRGGRLTWRLVSFVNIVGPIAYFTRGRRRAG